MAAVGWFIRILAKEAAEHLDWITVPSEPGTTAMMYSGDYEVRKLTVSWSRTPTVGVVQDRDQCTFHFLNLTGGNPDATWNTADFTTVETAFDAFWAGLTGFYTAETKLVEYLWRKDGPAFRPHGTEFSPTVRLVSRSVAGTSGSLPLPPQCAMSVTEVTAAHYTAYGVGVPGQTPGTGKTQVRNRWGRFYLPAQTTSQTTDGRWSFGHCSTVSGLVKTMYDACVAAQIVPVMYSPTTGSSWSIDSVHVDDIVDVVRSRRYITPTTRASVNINPV